MVTAAVNQRIAAFEGAPGPHISTAHGLSSLGLQCGNIHPNKQLGPLGALFASPPPLSKAAVSCWFHQE